MTERLDRVLVVGASLAGLRAAEALRAEGFEGELVMLGKEDRPPYDRPPLSKGVLAGTVEPETLPFAMREDLDLEFVLGEVAAGLDLNARRVHTAAGEELDFDGLVIATGSEPRRLPGLDPREEGVHELRTLDDALRLRAALGPGRRLAIVGAGFVGIEVTSTALGLGCEVEIVSLLPPLAIAGELVSGIATDQLAERRVPLHLGRTVKGLERCRDALRLRLDDETTLEADAVLVAVGAVPAVDWLVGSGLGLDNGVLCDPCCAAIGTERVVAAGDVARWTYRHAGGDSLRIEHWTNAVEQARAATATLLRGSGPERRYAPVPSFWSDHFGSRVQSLGLPGLADRFEVVRGELADRKFLAEAYRGEELVGGVAYEMPGPLAATRPKLQTEERGVTV